MSRRGLGLGLGIGFLALALALAPSASASGFTFTAGKSFAADADASGANHYAIPFTMNQAGYVYAKLLDTPGSVINSSAPNGGWSVDLVLKHGDGSTVDLGTFKDGKASIVVPVANGEAAQLLATLRWPASAAKGGVTDVVYGALAFRLTPDGTSPTGDASGGTIDESRAWNIQVRFVTDGAVGSGAVGGGAANGTTTPPVDSTPSSSGLGAPPAGTTPASATPPVSALPTPTGGGQGAVGGGTTSGGGTTVVVVQESFPTWFLVVLAAEGAAIVLLVAMHYRNDRRLRDLERVAGVTREVPVREEPTGVKAERR